jgi:aryl sulfotransferase
VPGMRPTDPPQRLYRGAITNSGVWASFEPRPDDIFIVTPPKSGTTWTQGIVSLLLAGPEGVSGALGDRSPWVDADFGDVEERRARVQAVTGRRYLKTHTPLDGIPLYGECRYLTVFRHPLDVLFSMRRHVANMRDRRLADRHPEDMAEAMAIFLSPDDALCDVPTLAMILAHYRASLRMEDRANVLRLHYANLLRDLPSGVARIAAHIGLDLGPERLAEVVRAAGFEAMKDRATVFAPAQGTDFWRNDQGFFDSASSAKWVGRLGPAELAAYDVAMDAALTRDERAWIETGRSGQA